jgi:hypothetical protein
MSDQVRVPSYFVLVEPDRWLELGDEASTAPWSMKYLFLKQLEEADFIVVTKLDTLTNDAGREIQGAVQRAYTEAKVLGISARLGLGLEHWIELAQTMSTEDRWLKDIDYQRYAEAEAEMGWLNAKVSLTFPEPRDGKVIAARMAEALVEGVSGRDGSIGHLKLLAVGNTGSVKAGLTRFGRPVEFDGAFTGPLTELQVTLNMRATVSPGDLTAIALACLERLKMADRAETDVSFLNTFRPAPPKPTFRYDQDN